MACLQKRQQGRLALLAYAILQNAMVYAQSLSLLDKPAMRLYGIFSTVEGPWGAGGGMTWTDEDVSAASHLEMAFPVR